MSDDEREALLTQAYDAEQRGDLAEAERLRKLAHAPQEPPALSEADPVRRACWQLPWYPVWRGR